MTNIKTIQNYLKQLFTLDGNSIFFKNNADTKTVLAGYRRIVDGMSKTTVLKGDPVKKISNLWRVCFILSNEKAFKAVYPKADYKAFSNLKEIAGDLKNKYASDFSNYLLSDYNSQKYAEQVKDFYGQLAQIQDIIKPDNIKKHESKLSSQQRTQIAILASSMKEVFDQPAAKKLIGHNKTISNFKVYVDIYTAGFDFKNPLDPKAIIFESLPGVKEGMPLQTVPIDQGATIRMNVQKRKQQTQKLHSVIKNIRDQKQQHTIDYQRKRSYWTTRAPINKEVSNTAKNKKIVLRSFHVTEIANSTQLKSFIGDVKADLYSIKQAIKDQPTNIRGYKQLFKLAGQVKWDNLVKKHGLDKKPFAHKHKTVLFFIDSHIEQAKSEALKRLTKMSLQDVNKLAKSFNDHLLGHFSDAPEKVNSDIENRKIIYINRHDFSLLKKLGNALLNTWKDGNKTGQYSARIIQIKTNIKEADRRFENVKKLSRAPQSTPHGISLDRALVDHFIMGQDRKNIIGQYSFDDVTKRKKALKTIIANLTKGLRSHHQTQSKTGIRLPGWQSYDNEMRSAILKCCQDKDALKQAILRLDAEDAVSRTKKKTRRFYIEKAKQSGDVSPSGPTEVLQTGVLRSKKTKGKTKLSASQIKKQAEKDFPLKTLTLDKGGDKSNITGEKTQKLKTPIAFKQAKWTGMGQGYGSNKSGNDNHKNMKVSLHDSGKSVKPVFKNAGSMAVMNHPDPMMRVMFELKAAGRDVAKIIKTMPETFDNKVYQLIDSGKSHSSKIWGGTGAMSADQMVKLQAAMKQWRVKINKMHKAFDGYMVKVRSKQSVLGMNPMREQMLNFAEMMTALVMQQQVGKRLNVKNAKQARHIEEAINLSTGITTAYMASFIAHNAGVPMEAVYANLRVMVGTKLSQSQLKTIRSMAPIIEKAVVKTVDPVMTRLMSMMSYQGLKHGAKHLLKIGMLVGVLLIVNDVTDFTGTTKDYLDGKYTAEEYGIKLLENFVVTCEKTKELLAAAIQFGYKKTMLHYYQWMGLPIQTTYVKKHISHDDYKNLNLDQKQKVRWQLTAKDMVKANQYFIDQRPSDIHAGDMNARGKGGAFVSVRGLDNIIKAEIPRKNFFEVDQFQLVGIKPNPSIHGTYDLAPTLSMVFPTLDMHNSVTRDGHYGFLLPSTSNVVIKRYRSGTDITTGQPRFDGDQLSGLALLSPGQDLSAKALDCGWQDMPYVPRRNCDKTVLSVHVKCGKISGARLITGEVKGHRSAMLLGKR